MNTIFFTESSRNLGGQEYQLLAQAQQLKAQGYAPRILCRPGSRIQTVAQQQGLPVELLAFRNALHVPSWVGLWRLLTRNQPVAVVCHSGHDANVSACVVLMFRTWQRIKRRVGLSGRVVDSHPVTSLQHAPKLIRMRTYQPGPARAFAYNHLFDITFTPSHALRQQLLQNPAIKPHKIQVLYPGIDFEAIANQSKQPLSFALSANVELTAQRPVIVHAAMFRAEKGHVFMLDVVQALLTDFPNLLYIAAGEGEGFEAFQREIQRRHLSNHVITPGLVKPIAALLAKADVVVMPSDYEPLGMTQIEALGLGIPVVVSQVGGLPETVQHEKTGWVCPAPRAPNALPEWVSALRAVFLHPQQAKNRANQGQAQVTSQFAWSHNLAQLQAQWHVEPTFKPNAQ